MQLGEALKTFRKDSNMLQKQMAAKLGITTEYYNKIEKESVAPSGKMLAKIIGLTKFSVEFHLKKPGLRFTIPPLW
ncbi:MAG: helix-turn-helix transcriptional regulator [Candidatus Kryptoniota bacterium]